MQGKRLITIVKTIGERIKFARRERGMTQSVLAKLAGVTTSAIGNIEAGYRERPRELVKIADALRTPPQWLETGEGHFSELDFLERLSSNEGDKTYGKTAYPVISAEQAAIHRIHPWHYEVRDGFDVEFSDDHLGVGGFFLKVSGEDMLPDFLPRDLVGCNPNLEPLPGDVVVASNHGAPATLRKYRLRGVSAAGKPIFELAPLNTDYETLLSTDAQITITGVVLEHRRRVDRRR